MWQYLKVPCRSQQELMYRSSICITWIVSCKSLHDVSSRGLIHSHWGCWRRNPWENFSRLICPQRPIWAFPEMAYTKFMTTCMLQFLESYTGSYPRIILRIIPMILKPCVETSICFNWVGKSWWSSHAVKSCVQFLCQTMSPEWICDLVHKMCIVLKVFDTAICSYFSRNSCTPESHPESYPIHTPNHT